MQLNLKTFNQLIEDMAAALQGSASSLVDVTVGSVIRAIFEANAAVVLWLQWLILQVLSMTRAATSTGPDLDSWMADFGVLRLAATPATGVVSFSRYAANLPALVVVGTTIKTADGLISFAVTEDATLSIWQAQSSGYLVPSGVTSADLPVACVVGGAIGNVLPGTITMIASSLPGIDQAVNAQAFTNGEDIEADSAFRARFQNYLASRVRATLTAVRGAISNVQQGLLYIIKENTNPDGTARLGSFLIVIDDGSGYPSDSLLSSVSSSVDQVRPIGTTFTVVRPLVLSVNVSVTAVVSQTGGGTDAYGPMIQQKITAYLDSLPIESIASVTRVAQSAYAASANIQNVTNVTLNGVATDVQPPARTIVKAGQVTVLLNAG